MTIQRYEFDRAMTPSWWPRVYVSEADHLAAMQRERECREKLVEALKDASFAYATEVITHGTITQKAIDRLDKWDAALAAAKEIE